MPLYTSVSHLQARLTDAQITITATSVPNTTQAEAIIDQVEAECHAYLRNRYALPITDPEAIAMLRSVATSLAIARIYRLAYPQSEFNPFSDEEKQALQLLRDIAAGKAALPVSSAPTPYPVAEFGDPPEPTPY